MKSKIALITSLVFFIIYSLMCTIGSIFLVTWGEATLFKSLMNFTLTFPINWDELIMESMPFLIVHIVFWTIVVYLFVIVIEKGITVLTIGRKG